MSLAANCRPFLLASLAALLSPVSLWASEPELNPPSNSEPVARVARLRPSVRHPEVPRAVTDDTRRRISERANAALRRPPIARRLFPLRYPRRQAAQPQAALPETAQPVAEDPTGVEAAPEAILAATVPEAERALPDTVPAEPWGEIIPRIRRCLATYSNQRASVATQGPWEVMHWIVAYGVDAELNVNGFARNGIGWLCWNGPCRGERLFALEQDQLLPRQGAGLQGHPGQFLAILAQSKVPHDYEIRVSGREFTVRDLVEHEQSRCRSGKELTFTLIGLCHYLPSDAVWTNADGESWSIPRLIREELSQPVLGTACGGTHRMMALSYAVWKREKRNEPVDGEWKRARTFVRDFQQYALTLQNEDGSHSTRWFEGRATGGEELELLKTTGHVIEWLVFSLPDEELRSERITRGVRFLVDLLLRDPDQDWNAGSLGHALRALALYDERISGRKPGERGDLFTAPVRTATRAPFVSPQDLPAGPHRPFRRLR